MKKAFGSMTTPGDFNVPTPPLTFMQSIRYSHDPRLVWFHLQQVNAAETMLASVAQADRGAARAALKEIASDTAFLGEFLKRHQRYAGREPKGHQFMFMSYQGGSPYFHQLVQYALVRLLRPAVVVETGGTPGNSSAFILRALERNGKGELHTVDLPPTGKLERGAQYEHGAWIHENMPEGQESGWAVPETLRQRHQRHLGDARELLPQVLDAVETVDLFIHDSDHSYEHMMFEFRTAWPHIRPGGVLMSDDIDNNRSWADFTGEMGLSAYRTGGLGAARKP